MIKTKEVSLSPEELWPGQCLGKLWKLRISWAHFALHCHMRALHYHMRALHYCMRALHSIVCTRCIVICALCTLSYARTAKDRYIGGETADGKIARMQNVNWDLPPSSPLILVARVKVEESRGYFRWRPRDPLILQTYTMPASGKM